ncbi:hypothetical protein B9G69_003390 [Bdellovibrio sp. SKB1291214]|uniref:hypothetical protein n=1 Tax=Bdellovibrio sp. SKB1291214 TaxID=1732569 RepID=UPI000B51777E|nr:hypothetical protein [Bdellovibrio sp. SKB1291214]UYL09615.1 hypothetical protein B9G69_003390 [Bdellovibrio sp. SKB1291214]
MNLIKILIAICVTLSFSWAHADDEFPKTSTRVPVETGKYITGGVLTSAVGFGIGHGIQGRYAEKGWIFTATETAGLAMVVAGAASCDDEVQANGSKKWKCDNDGLILAGFGVWIGFHVWEIVDAWTGATPVDSDVKAFFIPNPKAPGLGLAYSF